MIEHKLVIAEKPSVAKSIAAVLKATNRKDGYLEGGGFLVSWCVGHLVELADASTYEERYAKWALSDLPILPEYWKYVISPDTRKQFDILKELMSRDDVTSLVCATDAGREGELIFRLVYEQAKCKSRWNGCGFPPWRIPPSGRALNTCGQRRTMKTSTAPPSAGQEPGLAGGNQRHPPVFLSLSPDTEHRAGNDPDPGTDRPERGRH